MSTPHLRSAVFDANVFVQALANPDGASGRCLSLALSGEVRLVTSTYVLDELGRISHYPKVLRKFPALAARVPLLIDILAERNLIRPPPPPQFIFDRDPKDAPYVDLAIASGAFLIVSRDTDLLDLMLDTDEAGRALRSQHPHFRVLTPPALLAEIDVAPR